MQDGARLECFNFFDASGTPSSFHSSAPMVQESAPSISLPSSSRPMTAALVPSNRYISVAVVFVYAGTRQVNDAFHKIPMAARVSVADYRGRTLLDTYVRPIHPVQDFRVAETGLQYSHLASAPSFSDVQQRVMALIRGKIIVGHRIWMFLSVIGLKHLAIDTRDLALFRPLRKKLKSHSIIELDTLIHLFMGRRIGLGYEDSMELARAAMDLFRSCREVFEEIVRDGAWPCDLPPTEYGEHYL